MCKLQSKPVRIWNRRDVVPQTEGQQSARLLVEFQMDALQLPCSHQLVGNDGCWTLTLQTVLPTPEKHTKRIMKGRRGDPSRDTGSSPTSYRFQNYSITCGKPNNFQRKKGQWKNNVNDSVRVKSAVSSLVLSWCKHVGVWVELLLRSLVSLAVDGW